MLPSECDIAPVAFSMRHSPCRITSQKATQGQSGVPEILLPGTSPKREKHYTVREGSMLIMLGS
ncbi:hypothetical protein Taro_016337 [Colocasia esculenta]|uniref:Uncharacterized protein n=1 Tax=Colocasia esculenta TaxID=4460 RepID=A0A843UK34_COLES|nr:hypothetical protein [Colocasia esculenta]